MSKKRDKGKEAFPPVGGRKERRDKKNGKRGERFNLRRRRAQLRLLFSVTPLQNVENFYAFASDDREMQRGLRFLACHRPPVLCICMEMRVPPFSLLSGKRAIRFSIRGKEEDFMGDGRIHFEPHLLAFKS